MIKKALKALLAYVLVGTIVGVWFAMEEDKARASRGRESGREEIIFDITIGVVAGAPAVTYAACCGLRDGINAVLDRPVRRTR